MFHLYNILHTFYLIPSKNRYMILLKFLMPEFSEGIKLCKNAIHTTHVQKLLVLSFVATFIWTKNKFFVVDESTKKP